MKESITSDITALLKQWQRGDGDAFAELTERIYPELYMRARRLMLREGQHSFSSTDLVGELYVRLMAERDRNWQNRSHFLGCAATIMRNILVNHAQARFAKKRGGGRKRLPASTIEETPVDFSHPEVMIQLEQGLKVLAEKDARQVRIFELRNILGLTAMEIAEVLEISTATVRRETAFAKAWLSRYIREGL